MTTDRTFLHISEVAVEVVRKDIKNLHIGVYPPEGRVRVAAPIRLGDDEVRLAVVSRLAWIRERQARFASQNRQSEREFVTGETHYFEGERYRLDVLEGTGRSGVRLRNRRIMELRVPTGADRKSREAVLHRWYRRKLQARIPALREEWESKIGVSARELRIKRMKTLWGSCNTKASRIWLNLELAKKPPSCLAFVLAHEMVHLLERHHNERFIELMDAAMPQWRLHRDELNRAPLAHEDWGY
ncbi:MAG: M48 family metallopeptidase [Gammaproteobacteria bacterium]|nr:M48 family metallopeptidase [Gammaproteobacteria bacterium]MYE51685.1 M48 family metallopeptidase [Gammaproteobacteria bacterium]MYF10949.1 M48 family metallopeptidase [Gammaproteobacteria bacterium]MYH17351.1 M48 family metallopeptidase [Gammaproteobacteria bacterium]